MTRPRDERGRFLPATIEPRIVQQGEYRDPRAATTQLTYMGYDAPMVAEWDAGQAVRFGYYANVIAYRCIQIKARAIAALPVRCGPDSTDRTKINMQAPLARLLGPPPGGPAPKLAARKLIAWSLAQKYTTGRFAWELELDDAGVPLYFWPLVSDSLKAIPTDSGSEWFRAFTYGRAQEPTRLTPDRVYYDWTPSQHDFRQPESALQAARYDLTAAVMGDRYSVAFLKNGAVPAALVVTQRPPTQPAQDRFEQRWSADYQGPDNANRVGFQYVDPGDDGDVSKMIDVKMLGLSQKDARFIEQHKAHLEQIAIALGVPWSKLDASGRTFDNAGHEDATFWETLSSDIADFEDAVNLDLAPRIGPDLMWFDTAGVESLQTARDPLSAKVGAPSLFQARIMTRDEARGDYGLAPIGGTFGGFITDEELAKLNPPQGGQLSAPSPEVRSVVVPPELPASPPAPVDDDERQAEEDRAAAVELRRARIWRTADAQVRSMERRWERSMRRLFNRQARSVDDALHGKRGHKLLEVRATPDPQFDISGVFNPAYWADQTEETTSDLYEGVTSHGFARVADLFGIDFDLEAPYAQEFIHARALQLAGQITETTYAQIQQVLADGVRDGLTLDELAAGVQTVFTTASEARAVTIARTEVVSAFNGSATLAAAQLPEDVVGGQEWIATRDGRTREEHSAADGQVVPVGEAFDVDGALLAYPGDPSGPADLIVNCRCTVGFVTPEEMADLNRTAARTIERRTARALLATVMPGEWDEHRFRSAMREVAA